jgi:hypothetical protein
MEIKKLENNYILLLNEFSIDEEDNIISPNSTWFLLKKAFLEERMNDYHLKEGDILRIGRITIKIKKIKFHNPNKNSDNISINTNLKEMSNEPKPNEPKYKSLFDTSSKKESEKYKICRICYLEEESIDNPLIQPCVCSGSMKYIHLDCLKQWLHTSIFVKIDGNNDCYIYLYKTPECELCKTKFTDYIRNKGKLYEILDFQNDFNSYLVIESLTLDKNNNKYLYVVNLDVPDNKIKVGRGHDCSLLLSDISVSRFHCSITIDKNTKKIYMHDNNSKFGTLVLVQTKNLNMCMDLKLCIQIGRTYLELYLKEPFNLFGCCGVREKKNADFYYIQNKENVFLFNKLTIKTENDIQYFNKYQLKRKEEKNQRKIDNLITENNLIDGDKDNNIGNKNSNANNDNKNEGKEVKEPKENNNNENSFDDIEKLIYDENEQENNNENNNENKNENNNENNNDVNELEAQKDIDKNEDNINVNENNENVNNSNDINHQLNLSELNNIYT